MSKFAEGIPILKKVTPPPKRGGYNFRALEIGDCVEVPIKKEMRSQSSNLSTLARQQGIKVTVRIDRLMQVYRVWRIA
jgi:hypothetical protein